MRKLFMKKKGCYFIAILFLLCSITFPYVSVVTPLNGSINKTNYSNIDCVCLADLPSF
jgi:hypothetical protein